MPKWRRETFIRRLWARVDKTDDCWVWQGRLAANGYGRVVPDGRDRVVHRVVYELLVGPVAEGLTLDHLCRNRACVNPAHLEPVTNRENILRGESPTATNARKTHCIHGHEFTEENTYMDRGRRMCRTCNRDKARALRLRRALA